MTAICMRADDVLRRRYQPGHTVASWRSWADLIMLIVLFGIFYGAVIGTFGGLGAERSWHLVYSAIKIPLLLLATFVVSLPSFFVLNSLFGLRRDFVDSMRSLVAAQAALAIVLASLAPLTMLWYLSSADYQLAILCNVVMFTIASLAAQWLLRGYYRPLVRQNRKHRWMLWSWIAVYALVGIQMGWILRPFIGSPGQPVQFFRTGAWDNAYVIVARLIWQTIVGS